MKITLIFSFVLCCVSATAQEPVQLEVWRVNKSNPFRGVFDKFCYLPNFRNGLAPNAMVVRKRSWDDKTDRMETWYNRDIADTLNQFTWPFGFCPSLTPDINGDGQRDFFEGTKFYLGTKNDEPDTTIQYKVDGNIAMIDAFNDDARDDFFLYGSGQMPNPYIAHFVFSNPTLKNFKKYSLVSKNILQDEKSEEIAKAIYKNKQGQWRLLTYCRGWVDGLYQRVWVSEKSVIRLYSLEFTTITEDSASVTATQIDEYRDPKWMDYIPDMNTQDDLQWRPFNNQRLLYNTEHYPKILYYASMNTMPDKDKKYDAFAKAFDLTDDKIRLLDINIPNKTTDSKKLQYSITGNNYEEIYYVNGDGTIQFMKINEDNIPQRICYIDRNVSPLRWGNVTHLQAVKDINNDGINDIACLLSSSADGNTLAIVKGQNITTSLEDKTYISEPYPIPSTTQLAIPLYIASPHHYTLHLYSQTGKEVKVLFDGDLSSGSHTLHCNISDFPSGTYILRLSDGTTLIDRLIIINH